MFFNIVRKKQVWTIAICLLVALGKISSVQSSVQQQVTISFTASNLTGDNLANPTSLQFGPDGRLYVSQQNGLIYAYTIARTGPNNYIVQNTELINIINTIPNHNDTDGAPNASVTGRQITGIYVTGTGAAPIIYVTSSDPRIGAGGSGADTNLDTNSGIISRLTWTGTSWDKVDLVRGLPRSEENHSPNGMQIEGNILYVPIGGNTNAGSPSNNFAFITEYALSTAVLAIDLEAINSMPIQGTGNNKYVYDIPTLDDPTRANNPDGSDPNDPFGGNDGLNQAKLVEGGPIELYSTGYRNAYDLVITTAGRMYVMDNGANGGWGGHPAGDGTANCTNEYLVGEPGSNGPGPGGDAVVNNKDNLHYVPVPGYYAGHPNPIRGNPAGAGLFTHDGTTGIWRTDPADLPVDWPPVPLSMANPEECDYRNPGVNDGALATWAFSTNGITEYTADNFAGALAGNLLTASFDGTIYRVELSADGIAATNVTSFASNFGSIPLDVTAQGEGATFSGTIWAATYGSSNITIFEPADYDGGVVVCTGADDPVLDEDSDGYTNADEIDNGTNPCSGASKPTDNDNDLVSDLNDPDDDNDTLLDTVDHFALDAQNGKATNIPVLYNLLNNDPGTGFFGLGFMGLMSNGTNYSSLFDSTEVIGGGTSGLLTIPGVSTGDALLNTQENGFQFGVNTTSATLPFTIKVRLLPPFFGGVTPQDFQSHGFYIGTGSQDDYLKVALIANGGVGGIQVASENGGIFTSTEYDDNALLGAVSNIDLYLTVNPANGTVQPKYAVDNGAVIELGTPITLSGALLSTLQGTYQVNGISSALAVGVIASSRDAQSFAATWDYINIVEEIVSATASVLIGPTNNSLEASTYTNGSFIIENTSTSGQKITSVSFDFSTALLPDLVFDPFGVAGDVVAKDLQIDSGGAASGFTSHNFASPHNGVDGDEGYNVLNMLFNDFDTGEVVTFSIDADPTSIKGVPAPGPGESGSVSGLELTGTTVTVNFDDGTSHSVETYRTPNSNSASQNIVRNSPPTPPTIQALGVVSSPAVVTQANQVIRVTGAVQTEIALLIVEGAMFEQAGGGYDVDPFEANSAVNITELTSFNTGASGSVDIPITLTQSIPEGGFNYIVAVLKAPDGMTSTTSNTLVLQFDPATVSDNLRINAGGPEVTTSGITWAADQHFMGGNPYEDVRPIDNTNDDVLYQTERYGDMTYAIPVQNGNYTVNLHFAEIYFGVPGAGPGGVGSRVFDATLEGAVVLDNYDIYADAGPATAVIKSFPNINITDGFINLSFISLVDNAKISAIEILPAPPNNPPTLQNPISDTLVNVNSSPTVVDLSNVFNDNEENPINLQLSVQGNTNATLVAAVLDNATKLLTLTYAADATGNADITIRATDSGGLFIEDTFTVQVNSAPTVANPVADVTTNINSVPTDISLATVFTDVEDDPTSLTLSLENNTNTGLVSGVLNGTTLTLTYVADTTGTADITIRATDSGGLFVEDTFTITVLDAPNTSPTVANAITDLTVNENSLPSIRDLTGVFTDVEDANLLLSIETNTNAALVTPTLNGSQLTLTYATDTFGMADITLRATDSGGLFVEDTFTVTVVDVPNTPPTVANPIADVNVNENSVPSIIDLSGVFTDAEDDPDTLVLLVANNTNTSLVTPTLNGTQLTLTYAIGVNGTSDITIRATDSDGASVEDTFTVTVALGNTSPIVVNPIADVNVNENDPSSVLDLASVFDDAQDGAAGLVLSIQNNDNPATVTPTLNGTQLTLAYTANASGIANITIRATDSGGLFVDDSFILTITSVNSAPTIANPIADKTVNENSTPMVIDLTGLFTDIEDGSAGLVLSVQNNSNTALVTPTLNGTQLTLTLTDGEFGTADMTIRATDTDGLFIEDTFTLTVIEVVNSAPTLVTPIADQQVSPNSAPTVIDLAGLFTDIEDGSAGLVLTIQTNTNSALVSPTLNGTQLTLAYTPNATGNAIITIRATDSDGEFIEDSFTITVSNIAPAAINDVYSVVAGNPLNVAAPGVLTNDTFSGNLTITITQPAQGQVALQNDGSFTFTLTNLGFTGVDTFTYTLDNGSGTSTATVTINVTPRDSAPPKVIDVMIPNGAGGFLHVPVSTTLNFSQIHLQFSEDVKFADLSANYQLFSAGTNGVFDSGNCAAIATNGLSGDDSRYPIASLNYDATNRTATVVLNTALPAGNYRFIVCGSTSIEDVAGNKLDGNGDGIGGDDFIWNFAVTTPPPASNNNTVNPTAIPTQVSSTTTTISPVTSANSAPANPETNNTTGLPTTLPATGYRPLPTKTPVFFGWELKTLSSKEIIVLVLATTILFGCTSWLLLQRLTKFFSKHPAKWLIHTIIALLILSIVVLNLTLVANLTKQSVPPEANSRHTTGFEAQP